VFIRPLLTEQAEGQDIHLFVVGLIVAVFICIVLNTLNAVAGDKDVGAFFGAEDTLLHQIVANTIDFAHPLAFISVLLLLADFKYIRVGVTI